MSRLFFIVSLSLIFIIPQASASVKLPAVCDGFLNKTITNMENVWNTPSQTTANTWRRCYAIIKAKQDAQLKALKAKHQAWINR